MNTQAVWNQHADDLRYFIRSKVKDPVITEDLLHNAFIKIHTKLDSLKNRDKLKSWVFTITRNVIMDYFKSQKIEVTSDILDTCEEEYPLVHTEKDCLYGIIKNLPEKYRVPLFLSDIKGMKQTEVAKTLNQNLTTTKSQIQRARKLVAQGFIDCCGFAINEKGKLIGEVKDKDDCKVCAS